MMEKYERECSLEMTPEEEARIDAANFKYVAGLSNKARKLIEQRLTIGRGSWDALKDGLPEDRVPEVQRLQDYEREHCVDLVPYMCLFNRGRRLKDLRDFYFRNFERRDAELVELRELAYKGSTEYMLEQYRIRIKNPDMNPVNIGDDIERLEFIKGLEAKLERRTFSLDGAPMKSMLPLVKMFEPERKKEDLKPFKNQGLILTFSNL